MLRRHTVNFDELLAAWPLATNDRGAWCSKCSRLADVEGIEQEWRSDARSGIEVVVRCHHNSEWRIKHKQPEEEAVIFEFGSTAWDDNDVRRALTRYRWFAPDGVHKTVTDEEKSGNGTR